MELKLIRNPNLSNNEEEKEEKIVEILTLEEIENIKKQYIFFIFYFNNYYNPILFAYKTSTFIENNDKDVDFIISDAFKTGNKLEKITAIMGAMKIILWHSKGIAAFLDVFEEDVQSLTFFTWEEISRFDTLLGEVPESIFVTADRYSYFFANLKGKDTFCFELLHPDMIDEDD